MLGNSLQWLRCTNTAQVSHLQTYILTLQSPRWGIKTTFENLQGKGILSSSFSIRPWETKMALFNSTESFMYVFIVSFYFLYFWCFDIWGLADPKVTTRLRASQFLEIIKTLACKCAFYMQTNQSRDFPACPMAKTPCSPMHGAWVQSLVEELDPMCHNYK